MPMPSGSGDVDPYLWLEEVEGADALAWVAARNRATHAALAAGQPGFDALRARLRAAFDAEDRIPHLRKLGDRYYNFWQDEENPRGLWRRTTLAEYRKPAPDWEVVLDFDALGRAEGERWVFAGAPVLVPGYDRALVRLSRGGADAVVVREFDLVARRFVEGGFALPESKGQAAWAGPDEIFVATDFGPGTMTDSGYPRIVKLWRRGQPLGEAAAVFAGEQSDVSVRAWADLAPGFETELVVRSRDFFNDDRFLRRGGELIPLDVPSDAGFAVHRGRLFVTPRADWETGGRTFPAGSLLATGLDRFLAGARDLAVLFAPTEGRVLAGFSPTRNHVLVNLLDNVRHRVEVATPGEAASWTVAPPPGADGGTARFRSIDARAVDPDIDDRYFLVGEGYLTPPALALGSVGEGEAPAVLKREPARFDAEGLAVAQHRAISADGTRIPYFEVSRPGAAAAAAAAAGPPRPTLLYGYGGFEVAQTPRYLLNAGAAWLERGGSYAVANIRGGGELGPAWHRAALKAGRHRAFEDFIAVAEDLVRRGVATPARLGILGGSNGGLLMGNMLTMRPDLFGAVVAHVSLFDMRRYHRLPAGASWMAEYGDPDDPAEWAFLRTFSPYHNVKAGRADYPKLLITTSTRDDRVHPGHARKMAAKMLAMGHDVLYHENVEGGHAGAADNAERAHLWALVFRFLWEALGDA